jgi:hypothetical protein
MRKGNTMGAQSKTLTVEIPAQEMAAIKQLTRLEDEAQAIVQAAREYLRLTRLREPKSASGRVDFDVNWQELEDFELNESSLPQ